MDPSTLKRQLIQLVCLSMVFPICMIVLTVIDCSESMITFLCEWAVFSQLFSQHSPYLAVFISMVIAAGLLFRAHRKIVLPVHQALIALRSIQRGDYQLQPEHHRQLPERHEQQPEHELFVLTDSLRATLQHYDAAQKHQDQAQIIEYASRLDAEIRMSATVQNYLNDIDNALLEAFHRVAAAPKQDSPNLASRVNHTMQLLAQGMVNARLHVGHVLTMLEKKALPSVQQLSVEPLSHFTQTMEYSVAQLSARKNLKVSLNIQPRIAQSQDYVFMDIRAGVRLLSLGLEFWPKTLQLTKAHWHVAFYVKEHLGHSSKLRMELRVKGSELDESQWLEIQAVLARTTDTPYTPLQKMMANLLNVYHVTQSVSFTDEQEVIIGYESHFFTGSDKQTPIQQYKEKYGRHHPLLLIGSQALLQPLAAALNDLHFDCIVVPYASAKTFQSRKTIKLAIVDCVNDVESGSAVLASLPKHIKQLMTVAVVDKTSSPPQADEVLFSPVDPMDIVRIAAGLNGVDEV